MFYPDVTHRNPDKLILKVRAGQAAKIEGLYYPNISLMAPRINSRYLIKIKNPSGNKTRAVCSKYVLFMAQIAWLTPSPPAQVSNNQ